LKGANDLPVEQPTKFGLVINLNTAKGARCDDPVVAPRARRCGDRVTIAFLLRRMSPLLALADIAKLSINVRFRE
jgi:hypothetical protein